MLRVPADSRRNEPLGRRDLLGDVLTVAGRRIKAGEIIPALDPVDERISSAFGLRTAHRHVGLQHGVGEDLFGVAAGATGHEEGMVVLSTTVSKFTTEL